MSIDEAETLSLSEYIALRIQKKKYEEDKSKLNAFFLKQIAHICAKPYMKEGSNLDGVFVTPWDETPEPFKLEEDKFKEVSNHIINAIKRKQSNARPPSKGRERSKDA